MGGQGGREKCLHNAGSKNKSRLKCVGGLTAIKTKSLPFAGTLGAYALVSVFPKRQIEEKLNPIKSAHIILEKVLMVLSHNHQAVLHLIP